MELDRRAEIARQAVRDLEVGGARRLGEGGGDKVRRGGTVLIEGFEKDLKNDLYKIWNRMSSGSYFPPPVRAVKIPKANGDGERKLGIPTVADRVAQTVVTARLEREVEPIFHSDSYGYRPGGRRWMQWVRAGHGVGNTTG